LILQPHILQALSVLKGEKMSNIREIPADGSIVNRVEQILKDTWDDNFGYDYDEQSFNRSKQLIIEALIMPPMNISSKDVVCREVLLSKESQSIDYIIRIPKDKEKSLWGFIADLALGIVR
jgi:hypothetical protein